MRPWSEVEIDAWREVSRHLELPESIERLLALLRDEMWIDGICVRRFDPEESALVTVAAAGTAASPSPARSVLSTEDLVAIRAWSRAPEFSTASTRERRMLHAMLSTHEAKTTSPSARKPTVQPSGKSAKPSTQKSPTSDATAKTVLFAPTSTDGTWTGVVLLESKRAPRMLPQEMVRPLLDVFSTALANDARMRELQQLRESLEADKRALLTRLDRQDIAEAIVGAEAGLREVLKRVEQVAAAEAPVLLLGATGSGKEVIARAIHARSPRARGPMVKVNCGAIPSELVDSELFGHERGSFTGAVENRRGWFERADGGTLFLDEVGELPLAAQVRLLRVLQDGTIVRVGGQAQIQVDVRIVAATHRDLAQMVGDRTFREDLWYRIGVFPIRLPALRERPEDIPALANHFAWRAGKRLAGVPLVLAPQDIDQLLSYDWPGNVRELAAVIERAAILGDGRRLEIATALGSAGRSDMIRRSSLSHAGAELARAQDDAHSKSFSPPKVATLAEASAAHIASALEQTRGRIEGPNGAAHLLGINPHTLRSRMRKLKLDWRPFRRRE